MIAKYGGRRMDIFQFIPSRKVPWQQFHLSDYHCGLLRTHCTSDDAYAICQDTCQRKVERLECRGEPDFDSQVNSVNGVHDQVVR